MKAVGCGWVVGGGGGRLPLLYFWHSHLTRRRIKNYLTRRMKKQICSVEDQKNIRVTPPIESYFDHLKSSQEATNDHCNFQAALGLLNGDKSGGTQPGSNTEQEAMR